MHPKPWCSLLSRACNRSIAQSLFLCPSVTQTFEKGKRQEAKACDFFAYMVIFGLVPLLFPLKVTSIYLCSSSCWCGVFCLVGLFLFLVCFLAFLFIPGIEHCCKKSSVIDWQRAFNHIVGRQELYSQLINDEEG